MKGRGRRVRRGRNVRINYVIEEERISERRQGETK
jgi:hypothetical protein